MVVFCLFLGDRFHISEVNAIDLRCVAPSVDIVVCKGTSRCLVCML